MTTPAPVTALTGKRGGTVTVTGAGSGYDVLAGRVELRGVDPDALRRFGRDALAHLSARTGEHVSVPWDEPFPAAALLAHDGAELRLLDDGDDIVVMAFNAADKGGTGAGVTLAAVRTFAETLRNLA